MMDIKNNEITWDFEYKDSEFEDYQKHVFLGIKNYNCDNCGNILTSTYSELISLLEDANLLPDDFKHYCCFCYFFKKLGILHLKKCFNTWTTVGEDNNILVLYFYTSKLDRANYTEIFVIRVHDYERLLLE